MKNTVEINASNDSGTYTVWYQQRAVELHAGAAAAGGATSLTLQADRNADVRDDYYNGALIHVVSGSAIGEYTISDYVGSTRVCTLDSGSFAASDDYGIVPITPPECNDLIVISATLMALSKPSSTMDEKILQMYVLMEQRARQEVKEWLAERIIENRGVTIVDSM